IGIWMIVINEWKRLQPWIPKEFPLFITLNPVREVNPSKIHKTIVYEHPVFLPKVNYPNLSKFMRGSLPKHNYKQDRVPGEFILLELLLGLVFMRMVWSLESKQQNL